MDAERSGAELTFARVTTLIGIGLASGFFAGLFGIGGGVMVVPALVVLLGFDHRQAVATSLLAILPAVAISTLSYALAGSVNWLVGAIVAVGAVIGAQVGAWILVRISRRVAQWIFVVFLAAMIVQLLVVVPNRGATITVDAVMGTGLLVLGLVAGALSAILGIGGGGVAVPILMVWFGLGDIAAKGVSLVMMLPGVLSGLVANLRRKQVQVRAGLVIGVGAVLTGPLGAWVAHIVSPQVGAWLFAAFLVFIAVTMVREALRPTSLESGRNA